MDTPKEIAAELVDKMYFSRRYKEGEDYIPAEAWKHAKKCALIAIDFAKSNPLNTKGYNLHLEEIIQEINKL